MQIHPQVMQRFGRDPKEVFKRDNYQCLICGTNEDLTIDHIDGNGRNSKHPNNELSNLQTLCRRCHGRKDSGRGRRAIFIERECMQCQKKFVLNQSWLKFHKGLYCSKKCNCIAMINKRWRGGENNGGPNTNVIGEIPEFT